MELTTELEGIVKQLKKKFSNNNLISMGPRYEKAFGIPTGCFELDAKTQIGGIPRGRIIEIMGPASSGKTSLSLYLIKSLREQFPEDKRPQVIIDMERSIDTGIIHSMGLPIDEIIFVYPRTAEEALESWLELSESGQISFILIDSVDAMVPEKILNGEFEDADMGTFGKLMSKAMRQGSKSGIDYNTTTIFINQQRDSLKMFGAAKTTPGGNALPYYASMRLETMSQKASSTVENAMTMRIKIIKNKCGPPCVEPIEFDFLYGKGPDPIADLVNYGKSKGVLSLSSVARIKWPGTEEFETLCKGGGPGLIELLREDPELHKKVKETIHGSEMRKE